MQKEYFELAIIEGIKYHSIDELEPEIKMKVNDQEIICFYPGMASFEAGKKYNVKLQLDGRPHKIFSKSKNFNKDINGGFADYIINGPIIDVTADAYWYYIIVDCGILIEINIGKNKNYDIGDFICAEGELLLDKFELLN